MVPVFVHLYKFSSIESFQVLGGEGKLQTDKWQDKSGADRWTTKVRADTVQFLDSKGATAIYPYFCRQ